MYIGHFFFGFKGYVSHFRGLGVFFHFGALKSIVVIFVILGMLIILHI